MSKYSMKPVNYFVTFGVFAMVTVAVISAQARNEVETAAPEVSMTAAVTERLLPEQIEFRHLQVMPVVLNTLLDLPLQIDVNSRNGRIKATLKPETADGK